MAIQSIGHQVLSMSAADFATLASSWLASMTVVSGALYILVRLNIKRIQELQAMMRENTKRIDTHEKALNGALGKDLAASEHV